MWQWLTDYSRFPARRNCGDWFPWEVHLHQWSELAIGIAYVLIPTLIWGLHRQGQLGAYLGMGKAVTAESVALKAFVGACGLTHFLESLIFDVPCYPLLGIALVVTALMSWWNVLLMLRAGAGRAFFR